MIKNLPRARTIILSASHNIYDAEEADKKTLEEAEGYKKQGRQVHKFRRVIDSWRSDKGLVLIDRLKFLYPTEGLPMMAYSLISAYNSSAEKIAVIGSRNVDRVVEEFRDEFSTGNRFFYVFEGSHKKLSLANSFGRGYDALKPFLAKNELSLFLPADMPLLKNIETILTDVDIANNNAVLNCNACENLFPENTDEAFKVFSRVFYDTLIINGRRVKIKEPHVYLLNFNHMQSRDLWPVVDVFFGSRKPSAGGFSWKTIINSIRACLISHPFNHLTMIRRFSNLNSATGYLLAQGAHDVLKRTIDIRRAEKIAGLILNTSKVRVKAENSDLGAAFDNDSYEDYELTALLLHYHPELFPYQDMADRLRHRLREQQDCMIPFKYIDYRRKRFGLPRLFDADGNMIETSERQELANKAFRFFKR